MANLKHMNNDMAVSPIVATLVLIVVAVIGAVAVGTIMGTFSTDVSKQANAGNAAGASQTEIIVAGSTTVDPVTQAIAKIYNKENPGVKISSQATGSGAGFQAVTLGVADIGAMSENPSTAQLTQNPNTQVFRIGSGAVAVITNAASPGVTAIDTPIPYADLKAFFTNNAIGTNIKANAKAVTRADSSGTADTFYQKFLGNPTTLKTVPGGAPAQTGNGPLVQYVATTADAIGFCDFGYVATRTDVKILPINDGTTVTASAPYILDYTNATAAAKMDYKANVEKVQPLVQKLDYNLTLIHPLNYITNGNPTTIQNSFINFARSGDATPAFTATNTMSLSQIF